MRLLLLDNYDSFTYNLAQAFGALGCEVEVRRNDEITVEQVRDHLPERLVLSPGPGRPEKDGGISNSLVRELAGTVPILGVCFGHQCLAHVFGGRIVPAPRLMHGKTSRVHHDGEGIFAGLPDPFPAMRYHSLAVDRDTLPEVFEATAWTARGELMAMRHRDLPLHGVQFHPESYLCPDGPLLLRNFLENAHEPLRRSPV